MSAPKLTKEQHEALVLVRRIAANGETCPRGNVTMWARQASDLLEHGEVLTDAGRAALRSSEGCVACEVRRKRGFEGQCPACANERTRASLRGDK